MNTISATETAQEVKDLRAKLGVTQHVLAVRLGVDESTVRNWEQGRNRPLRAMRRRMGRILYRLERKAK
jgi:DNA-binding transcriptional regulator YiaG